MKEPVRHYSDPFRPDYTACGIILRDDHPDGAFFYVNSVTCKRCKRTDNYLLGCWEDSQREYDTDG